MVVGYARVSSIGQVSGYGLEVQEQDIKARYPDAEVKREQHTGSGDRPVLNQIIKELKDGDLLVVSKLDRMARNTVEGIRIVEDLFSRGVSVHVLNVGLLENTSLGRFFLTVMLAVAEMERSMIIERTAAGKAVAKLSKGYKEGRPKKHNPEQINHAIDLLKAHSYRQVERITGISKSTLVRAVHIKKMQNSNV